jgi:hypothetical protein
MRMPALRARSLTAPLLVAAAAALTLALAGCGGSASTTLDPIAQAAEATSHAGGARMSMHIGVTGETGESIAMAGSGVFNMSREEGELNFHMGAATGLPADELKRLGGIEVTELFKDGSLYMHSPSFTGKLPGDAKWLKLDLAKVQQAEGIDTQSLGGAQSDPAQFLRFLKAGGGAVTDEGRVRLGGVPTTHYAGSVDLEKAASTLPANDGAKLKASLQKISAMLGASKMPVQVWIDDQHRVRRMHMEIPFHAAGRQATTTIDYTLSEFGMQPAVNLPAGGETYDATQLGLSALNAG